MDGLLLISGIALVLAGLAGVIIPGLPGVVFIYLGLFFIAWADSFVRVGWVTLTVLLFIGAAAWGADLVTTTYGARRFGASRWAAIGAGVGTFVGLWFGLPGIIIGPFAGALLAEWIARKNFIEAGKAGIGTWIGLAVGTAIKIALVFVMIGIFLVAYLV